MDKEDARKQTLGEPHERRKQVIRLNKKGHKVMRIVALTGLSWPTVRTAINLRGRWRGDADAKGARQARRRGP
jgi:Winged helix-turn helix